MKSSLFFLSFVLFCLPLQADRVVLKKKEKVYLGKVEYRKSYIKIRTKYGLKTFKWKKIQSILEFPLHKVQSAEERKKNRELWEKKWHSSQGKGPAKFYQLGLWCREKGMFEEAKQAFAQTLRLKPEHRGARKRLGYLWEDGKWQKGRELFKKRFSGLKPKKAAGYYKLAKWCEKHGLYKEGEKVIRILLRKNNYNRRAIKIFKRLTARYIPKKSYIFPLKGRWKILVDRSRHHQIKCFAIWAYDMMKVSEDGRTGGEFRKFNSDYYAWNQPIYAVGDGVVKHVTDKYKDNRPGHIANFKKVNKILIDHGGGEFSFYCHIQKSSSLVKVGDKVKQGQMIARVGNSGASGMPHLHFTMMDRDYFSMPVWLQNYELEIDEDNSVAIEIACPQEGWIVESQFDKYFVEKKK